MRFGLATIAALVIGALGAHFLLEDAGYVFIEFQSYVVEMSVPVLVLLVVVLYALVRGVLSLWRAPRRFGRAVADRRHRRAGEALTRGLMHITAGDLRRGEKLVTRDLGGSRAPLVNYLMAARAAHLQGAAERRDGWLRLARQALPASESTVLLTQAEMHYEDGDYDSALAVLGRLLESDPDHAAALGLRARTYDASGDRRSLAAFLPRFRQARLTPDVAERLAEAALQTVFESDDLTRQQIDKAVSDLPADLRDAPRLKRLQALALDRIGKGDEAERLLRAALKRGWHPALVRTYGEIAAADSAAQLRHAERWLESRPEDADLLLAAARLCMRGELWGKARSYLESSLALAPSPDSYALYAKLLNALGDTDNAAQAYRAGLSLVSAHGEERAPLDPPPRPAPVIEPVSAAASAAASAASPATR